jgi:hypothetical protein
MTHDQLIANLDASTLALAFLMARIRKQWGNV